MKMFHKSCVYQVYPKSFHDSDNDGIGDIKGITQKLDYLKELGVDYIWSTPFFCSPQNDNGYDVSDYRNIDPAYGTMEELEELIQEADKRDIGLVLDMVFNHTSTEHEWFKKAMAGDPKYKEYYIFKDPKEDGSLPTNWVSKFGGPTWEFVPKFNQYYLHLFDKTQADLNWTNPDVRKELSDIIKYWIDKGIKGFRFDVMNLISKPDVFEDDFEGDGRRFYTDGKHVHEYLNQLNIDSGMDEKGLLSVGEMSSTTIENCIKYSDPARKELSMCFNFHHLKVDYKDQQKWVLQDTDFESLKDLMHGWQSGMQEENGWNAVFWCNHDQPRIVSRFGDDKNYPKESAKMLATMVHLLRGTPYIYQGEEIGMTNAYFTDTTQYRDVESLNYYEILKAQGKEDAEVYHILQERSRDNSRTPMQWDDSENAGFSKAEPWIEVIKNYKEINVKNNLADKDSVFYHYQKLVSLRKEYDIISDGDYHPLLTDHDRVFAYERTWKDQSLIVLNNFYGTETEVILDKDDLEQYECLITNYEPRKAETKLNLKPYESVVFIR